VSRRPWIDRGGDPPLLKTISIASQGFFHCVSRRTVLEVEGVVENGVSEVMEELSRKHGLDPLPPE